MKLISVEDRKGKRCYFCGTDLSVKYLVKVKESNRSKDEVEVYCCNRCVVMRGLK